VQTVFQFITLPRRSCAIVAGGVCLSVCPSVCLSFCEQDNSSTRLRMSTKHTPCPQKQSQKIFRTLLFRTDEIFIKFGELIPESTQDITAVAFPTKPV